MEWEDLQYLPVVEGVGDDEGGVGYESEDVAEGGGAGLVTPTESQPVRRRIQEILRIHLLLKIDIFKSF